MLQNQRLAILDILDWLVKSCKGIHATKSKAGHFGHLWLTCKTCKISCYKIKDQQKISTESTLTQISTESSFEVLTQQVIFFDLFWCLHMWGPWFCRKHDFFCQIWGLWKVLDFVEGKSLPWRAEIDLVEWPQGTWRWGPLQNRGVQHPPQIARGIFKVYIYIYMSLWLVGRHVKSMLWLAAWHIYIYT